MMRRRRCGGVADGGMMLAELLIAITLVAIISALATDMLISASRTDSYATADGQQDSSLRIAMERMTKYVRDARQILSTSSGTTLVLWIDANRDQFQDADELVTFQFAGGALKQTSSAGATTTITTGFTSASGFTYDVTPPATSVVTITLTTSVDVGARTPSSHTLTAQVLLRNR